MESKLLSRKEFVYLLQEKYMPLSMLAKRSNVPKECLYRLIMGHSIQRDDALQVCGVLSVEYGEYFYTEGVQMTMNEEECRGDIARAT